MAVSITSNHNRNLGSGQTGNLAHNRRDFSPHNVDSKLLSRNIVFTKRTLSEVYDESFGDAIDDYNKKQKRSDRRKYDRRSYFKHLFGVEPDSESAKKILTSNARGKNEIKSFNEELFQVGDCNEFGHFMRDDDGNFIDKNGKPVKWNKAKRKYFDIHGNKVSDGGFLMPNPKAEIAKEILSVFYMGGRLKVCKRNGENSLERLDENNRENADLVIPSFEERNPNFHVIYAIEHNDEWHGTPHIHIDYVPVGTGYVKGPEKQVGFERALFDMGFTNKNTAYIEWREKERQLLKDICNYYGLETKTRKEERSNNRGVTYTTDVYRQAIREGRSDAQMIRGMAKNDAEEIIENARREARSIKENAQNEAHIITEKARLEGKRLMAQNARISEENEKLAADAEQQREQIMLLADIAKSLPKKKHRLFAGKTETYEVDKEYIDDTNNALDAIVRYSKNKLASDEKLKSIECEKIRQEQLTREKERIIRTEAEELARQMVRQTLEKHNNTLSELEKKRQEYEELTKKIKAYIKSYALKVVRKIVPSFGKLSKEEMMRQINTAYRDVEQEQKGGDELIID